MWLGLIIASCSEVSGPDQVSNLGILESLSRPPRIELPATATVGKTIEVVIDTYGEWNCISAGETVVELVSPLTVEVTPVDIYVIPGPGEFCTTRPKDLRHVGSVSFEGPGEALVVIRGRRISGGNWWVDGGEEIRVERSVTVTAN